jgi:hypothetical protein
MGANLLPPVSEVDPMPLVRILKGIEYFTLNAPKSQVKNLKDPISAGFGL